MYIMCVYICVCVCMYVYMHVCEYTLVRMCVEARYGQQVSFSPVLHYIFFNTEFLTELEVH